MCVNNYNVSSVRLQMSNTFYEAAGQNWFTLDSVHIHYNWTQEATFNASEVYAPATSSYHCQHVSSLHKYDTLLVPSSHTDTSANWHITFTDFQVHVHKEDAAFCVTLLVMSAHSVVYHCLCVTSPTWVHASVFVSLFLLCSGCVDVSQSVYRLFGSLSICLFSHLLGCLNSAHLPIVSVPMKPSKSCPF